MSFKVPQWLRTLARLRSRAARADARHELRRRLGGEPSLPDGALRRVLVICHGNICRSPFGEALIAASAPALEVRSAGLHAGDANPADPQAIACAQRMGVSLAAHRSQLATSELLEWADLILVMQGSHVAEIARRFPQCVGRVRLLGDYLPDPPYVLPDPWGCADAVFDRVFTRLRTAADRLVARIAVRHSAG
jgi:protein-tyrosine phosphatase